MAGVNAYHFDQNVSINEFACMIILHESPLSIVDHIGCRKYSNSLQPLFKMVSRNTIKKDILSIYGNEREKSKHEIDKNQRRIFITTDMWTSQNKKLGFMLVTTHFIDGLWRLQSRVMRCFFKVYIHFYVLIKFFSNVYELIISFLVLIILNFSFKVYLCAISTYKRSVFWCPRYFIGVEYW